jgi:hypothetical protein
VFGRERERGGCEREYEPVEQTSTLPMSHHTYARPGSPMLFQAQREGKGQSFGIYIVGFWILIGGLI